MHKWRVFLKIMGIFFWSVAGMLALYNWKANQQAQKSSEAILKAIYADFPDMKFLISTNSEIFANTQNEETIEDTGSEMTEELPIKYTDENAYIGVLEIPALSLVLPVLDEWSYPKLKEAPCRYYGLAYFDNLVIMAHNYKSHFGKLKNISLGDCVFFIDMEGNVFVYQVACVEIYTPLQVEEMTCGEWDLMLFTCTLDGKSRIAVGCERI